jgi:hypothetical protein
VPKNPERVDVNDVVSELFESLRRIAPATLIALREVGAAIADRAEGCPYSCGVDCVRVAAVRHWAKAQSLFSPTILQYSHGLLAYWAWNPHKAQHLYTLWRTPAWIVPSGEEDKWLKVTGARFEEWAPDPVNEPLNDVLGRVKALYYERAQFHEQTYLPKRSSLSAHCEWFVRVQVLEQRPSHVARTSCVVTQAVDSATRKIAQWLKIRRRTWERGRPKTAAPASATK